MRQTAPSDPVELLRDFLPSILAVPDSAVLSMVEEYLYNSNDLVRKYSMYALYAFDNALVLQEILVSSKSVDLPMNWPTC